MKKILCSALLGSAVGAVGLTACDATPPPNAALSTPVPAEAIPPGETLVAVVRKSLAEIVRDPDPYSRARRLGALLPTLGPDFVPAAKQTLGDLTVDLRGLDLELLLRYWATYEPEAASNWALKESPFNYREAALFAAVSVWAQEDPPAALEAVWPWADMAGIESVIPIALVRGWYATGDPPELRRFLRDIPLDILGQRALAAYIRVVIERQGSDAVKRWAEALPERTVDDKSYKMAVFRRVVDALSQLDVEGAIAWCDLHCNGPYGADMRHLIARNWALYDGPAALAWLSGAPPGYERDLAVRVTFTQWAQTDREAALAWMAGQTAGEPPPWVKAAYPAYARLLSGEQPLEAIKWAEKIEDQNERERVVIGVARVWRSLDEAAAEKWLLQSTLSEEAREKARTAPPPTAPLVNE